MSRRPLVIAFVPSRDHLDALLFTQNGRGYQPPVGYVPDLVSPPYTQAAILLYDIDHLVPEGVTHLARHLLVPDDLPERGVIVSARESQHKQRTLVSIRAHGGGLSFYDEAIDGRIAVPRLGQTPRFLDDDQRIAWGLGVIAADYYHRGTVRLLDPETGVDLSVPS